MATAGEAELLECRLSMEDFIKMQSLFLPCNSSGAPGSMRRAEFVDRAWSSIGCGSQEEYGQLFDSVDVSREGWVDWERMASFLLLGLSEKEEHARAAAVPRWRPLRQLPAPHRAPVHAIAHLGATRRYLSVSKEGTLAVWDKELGLLKSHRLTNDSVKPKDLWVTGMVVLPNVHKIAISFTCKEICFYDLLSKQEFSCQYKLHGLLHTPVSLHYWYDPHRPEQAVLSFGDVGGQVSALCFRSALISLFERPCGSVEQDSAINISWAELRQGRHRCCYTLTHSGHAGHWVRAVRYLGTLAAFVSCSSAGQSGMALAWRDGEKRPLRVTGFNTEQGISHLDYQPELNLIATAGVNSQVCLWNPYLTSKPVGILRGHVTSVVAVQFMTAKKQLLSFSMDKVLRVWDVANQLCVQRLVGIFPKAPECKTLLFFHDERSRLLLSFNSALFLLEAQKETDGRVTSHASAVTCVLYNSLFRQVVSSDASSAVTCWLMDTGQKVKQFSNCHGDAEISTMAMDTTQTRLFTAGTDGTVKVWDFNGHCHHSLNAGRDLAVEISQILVLKRTVLVLGWERIITVFRLHTFSRYYVEPSEWKGGVNHHDDILCAAFRPPQTLVTGSCDGELIVWNNSTENALRKLHTDSQHRELRSSSDGTSHKATTSSSRRPSANSASTLCCSVPGGEEDPECHAVTRLVFLEGRKAAALSGGADLVSGGGSGVVRFWNSASSSLVGQFVAHKDSGTIILTVDSNGRYLVTADMDGGLKVWNIQDYCLHPTESVTSQAPVLLSSLRPHMDCITHLETCVHGDQLFLLSASADRSVALSFLPGPTVGIFGQEEHWHLAGLRASTLTVEGEEKEKLKLDQEADTPAGHQEARGQSSRNRAAQLDPAVDTDEDDELTAAQQLRALTGNVAMPGQNIEDECGIRLDERKQHGNLNGVSNIPIGTFSELRLEELDSVTMLTKPDFVVNPHLYFGRMWESSTPTPPPLPATRYSVEMSSQHLKAPFDERSLFPKEVLDPDRAAGSQHHAHTLGALPSHARAIVGSMGKPKASNSGVFKTK